MEDNGAKSYKLYISGDDRGLVEIIKEYRDGLALYINTFTRNISSAEEITEEVFFRIAAKKCIYRGKSLFKTWLFAIGRNTALDWLRKQSKFTDKSFEEHTDITDPEDIERSYLKEEQKRTVRKALDRLSEAYRQALYLTYIEGFSNAEAAAIMGKSKRQIENLVYRAKGSLKKELEKEGFSYEDI